MFGIFRRSQDLAPAAALVEPPMTRPKDGGKSVRFSPLAKRMMHSAAKADRLTASWPTTPVPADDIIRRHQRVIVARSREQGANNDYGRAFLRMCRQNIVGAQGIRMQAQARDPGGALDQVANDALENAWWAWGRRENCDVAGKLSFRAQQSAAVLSAAKDGEFFFRKITGADAGPWGFALQQLDPQRCPVDYDENRRGDGSFIRHGIEFNRYGRPLAYLFTTTDEREADYFYGGRGFVRIPAEEIIHGYLPEMVGQKRGLPWMATSLWRMQMLGAYEEAALINARSSAAKGGWLQWKEGYGPELEEDEDLTVDVEPGTWQELPAGVEAVANHPPYPVGETAPFRKEMLRGIAAGMGVAYNNLASDLEGVNFSSIRQGALDEREHWKELQEWLVESFIEPVFQEWLPRMLLAGRIKTPAGGTLKPERIEKYREVEWQPRRWAWIDPRADVAAAVEMKNNLMGSFGQFIRDQGKDPSTVWREVAEDINQMRAAGIPDDFIKAVLGKQGAANPARREGGGDEGAE
ncbi:phage portal protein [Cereibacter azotoformans]|uniref:phage portal protein n=1 Tax=Cereibacter azotoformans TaxID=43057 RepID=UPI003B21FF77